MNWSNIFDDEGGEEGEWEQTNRTERLVQSYRKNRASSVDLTGLDTPRRKEKLENARNSYTPNICYTFTGA